LTSYKPYKMFALNNILTIARYERRILLRSWFFRILAILSLLYIGVFSGAMVFEKNPFTWMFRSMPAGLIYNNLYLLNVIQSVIAVFLATDFMKRDKKLNTSEVLFIRPMSNLEYVLGKTWGLISVFLILNAILIVLTSVYLIISKEIPFQFLPVLYYFLLLTLPTLLFITGLSYTLMIVIRNQPITFLILLGYIALVMFYLGDQMNYLFDYMAFSKPMTMSGITGFSGLSSLITHRTSYLVLGISLILFTAWRLNRLPNRKSESRLLGLSSLILFVLASAGFYGLYSEHRGLLQKREKYAAIQSRYFDKVVPDMKSASIRIVHGEELEAHSDMLLLNRSTHTIDTLFFSINPGLKVDKVQVNGNDCAFDQNLLLVKVIPKQAMQPEEEMRVSMSYQGVPDFMVAYLDQEKDDVFGVEQTMTMKKDRLFGFYSEDYVLLTKEILWYPVPGIVYDPSRPAIFRQQFTKFDLNVQTRAVPISQGERSSSDSLNYHFSIRDPLPQLSLAIGQYVERTIRVEGIQVKLATIEGLSNYEIHFDELGDTLSTLILEFLDDYERPLGLFYPYAEFSLVEAPVQFDGLPHSWTSTQIQSQPQTVYFPEGGYGMRQADLASSKKRIKEDSERNKEGLSEKEIQARVFTGLVKGVFAESNADFRFGAPGTASEANPYSIFPNYYYYVNYITSDECPVLNYAFESYLMKGEDDPRMMFMTRMTGLSENEKANLLLKEKSLKQVIAEEENQQAVNGALRAKGSYLLTWMEKQIDQDGFEQYLLDYLYENSYREISYRELADAIAARFNIELGDFLHEWYNARELPAFGVGEYNLTETIEQNRAVFVMKTKVTNYSDVDGLVKFTFQLGGGGGMGRRGGGGGGFFGGGAPDTETDDRIFLVEAGKTKEIQMVLNDQPRSVIFNTLLSQNIPSSIMRFGLNAEKNEKVAAEEYERESDSPLVFEVAGELIVDNTDEGFTIIDPALDNPLRKLVEQRKKKADTPGSEYVGEGWGPAPSTWRLNPNADFYGKVEHTAMIVRSGDGSKTASWKKAIPAAAYYEVYVHLSAPQRFGPRRNNDQNDGTYHYEVMHDDGTEHIELEVKDVETGWNLLGSFYLSSDSAMVKLSDKGGANRVVADAVKWVIQR
jgi:ABC-type transport system involved in multi-copper enzyme maturation permease subunit